MSKGADEKIMEDQSTPFLIESASRGVDFGLGEMDRCLRFTYRPF